MRDFTGRYHCEMSLWHPTEFSKGVAQLRYDDAKRIRVSPYIWTNNPYVLDCFELDEVYVFNVHHKLIPFTDNATAVKWRGGMSTGEIWASLGDDWADKL
jgi:hypothetical protein